MTVTCRSPGLAVTDVGEPGVVAGVAPAVALGALVPPRVIADTRNEYAVPFVSPFTTADVVVDPVFAFTTVQVIPPSADCSIL